MVKTVIVFGGVTVGISDQHGSRLFVGYFQGAPARRAGDVRQAARSVAGVVPFDPDPSMRAPPDLEP